MKTITIRIMFSTFCLVLFISLSAAQDELSSTATALINAAPLDTTKTPYIEGLGESFTASDATSEAYVSLDWTVYQQCLLGTSNMSVTLYRDDEVIFSYTYPPTTFGYGYTHGYTDYIGPGKSHTYKLDRYCWGALCSLHWAPTNPGSTKPLQKPLNVSVSNPGNSDKFINMSWQNGSSLTTYYKIFEGNSQIATTTSTSYTVNTTPAKSANWSVATYTSSYGGHTSEKVGATVATASFHKPLNFFASEDTTVGYIRLGWTCASDYGTHFKIYRDDAEFTMIPVSQKSFLDYDAIPGQRYKYMVKTFNDLSLLFSEPSTEEFGRAVQFSASDGNYVGEVYLFWTDFPADYENELRIFRDGVRLDGVFSDQVEKYDKDIEPGKIHEYKLEAVKDNVIRLTAYEHGFAPADGSVKGSVSTPTGSGGVKNVEMRAYATEVELSSAVSLDGIDDYISVPALHLNSNTVTLSAWIKRDGAQTALPQ